MQNILLVEDDRVIVENLTEFLKGEGFWVTAVSGQTAALKALETQMFELVLLDVTLAEGNGYSACTAMKAQYDVPVIFLTALGDEFSVVTGLDSGRLYQQAVPSARIGVAYEVRIAPQWENTVCNPYRHIDGGYRKSTGAQRAGGTTPFGSGIPSPVDLSESPWKGAYKNGAFGRNLGCVRRICQ